MRYYRLNLERLAASAYMEVYSRWYKSRGLELTDIAVDRGGSNAESFRGRFKDGTEITAGMTLYDLVVPPQIPLESYL